MMNANATKVGCSFEKKGRLTSILCLYNRSAFLQLRVDSWLPYDSTWFLQPCSTRPTILPEARSLVMDEVSFTIEQEDFSQKDETSKEIKIFCEIRIGQFSEECLGIV
ncbi:hypothetical protein ANCCAN_27639 [Ancylostoma caninum]|uniref:Uncharacterized protein n=1 Tax=Ancylostoma caninum TaxID=29170 RepID=A0A368F3F8_ANCCA|nr:hypothetical protein ANCCAN_27639 [Ancylostoma caninum]